jgi:hypothetical protein
MQRVGTLVEVYLRYELYYPNLHGVTEKTIFTRNAFLSQVFITENKTEFIRNRDYTQLAHELISLISIRNRVIDQ